ncbi:4'-phosphopantetheinyl transferase superfamily protein [Streptomyces griseorubiginosus]|uniref:4'-phosphopantetheinyl transferase family protein n=1 Tax=Streptomyces griseorubiginosus TaxID=67304 RepID=UPI0033A0AAB1
MTVIPVLDSRIVVRSGQVSGTLHSHDLSLLGPEERARFSAFRDRVQGACYAAAHAAVRRLLSELLDCGAGDIRFGRHNCPGCGRTSHGRPYIRAPRTSLELSLSRSGPYWLCAIADGIRVGADVEVLRPVNAERLARLTGALLTGNERSYMAEVPAERLPAEFIRCWTRKEAVTKASGIGIEAAMERLDVQPERSRALVRHSAGGCPTATWTVQNLPTGPDHFAAVAFPAE